MFWGRVGGGISMKRARLFSVFFFLSTPFRKQDRSFARRACLVAFATKILARRHCFGECRARMASWFPGTRYLRKESTEWRCDGAAKAYLPWGGGPGWAARVAPSDMSLVAPVQVGTLSSQHFLPCLFFFPLAFLSMGGLGGEGWSSGCHDGVQCFEGMLVRTPRGHGSVSILLATLSLCFLSCRR